MHTFKMPGLRFKTICLIRHIPKVPQHGKLITYLLHCTKQCLKLRNDGIKSNVKYLVPKNDLGTLFRYFYICLVEEVCSLSMPEV